jgi:hypothetical protein
MHLNLLLEIMPPHELTVSMSVNEFVALDKALYGHEHGFGERILNLEIRSRSPRFNIKLPVTCRYSRNRPKFSTDRVTDSNWDMLCSFAAEEEFLRVEFCNSADSYDVRLSLPGKIPLEDFRTEMSLIWQKHDEAKIILRKGINWMKGKLP